MRTNERDCGWIRFVHSLLLFNPKRIHAPWGINSFVPCLGSRPAVFVRVGRFQYTSAFVYFLVAEFRFFIPEVDCRLTVQSRWIHSDVRVNPELFRGKFCTFLGMVGIKNWCKCSLLIYTIFDSPFLESTYELILTSSFSTIISSPPLFFYFVQHI